LPHITLLQETTTIRRKNAMPDILRTDLVVADITIIQDVHGRYNLNTLYQASETEKEKRPSDWLRLKSTKSLIIELESQVVNSPLDVVVGGARAGTCNTYCY
jgi:hypothetical protein